MNNNKETGAFEKAMKAMESFAKKANIISKDSPVEVLEYWAVKAEEYDYSNRNITLSDDLYDYRWLNEEEEKSLNRIETDRETAQWQWNHDKI